MALTAQACTKDAPPPPPAPTPQAGSIPTGSAGIGALMDKLSNATPPAQGSRALAIVRESMKTVYESPYKLKAPARATPLEQPLQRVGSESSADTTRLFPAVSAQVPKVWIGWYINRSIDALRQAIDENKPLVLVLAGDWCKYCVDLAQNSLRCAAIDRYAGDAVFAYSFPASDKGAMAIGGSLKIDAYPTITVLEPESRMLLERGRINGFFEAGKLGEHLDTILWKTPARVLPADWDGVAEPGDKSTPPPRAGGASGPATQTSALFGAASRGLTHAPPAPKCQ